MTSPADRARKFWPNTTPRGHISKLCFQREWYSLDLPLALEAVLPCCRVAVVHCSSSHLNQLEIVSRRRPLAFICAGFHDYNSEVGSRLSVVHRQQYKTS
jgi:hypothetical protein